MQAGGLAIAPWILPVEIAAGERKVAEEDPEVAFERLEKPASEWRKLLDPLRYAVLFENKTERPFTSPLDREKSAGSFVCAACRLPLFESKTKFDSGTACPNDLGRDVELMAEVAQRTRFQLICATGLYKQEEGGTAYWQFRSNFAPQVDAMAELFIREIEDGVGDTGIRAGIIKVATGRGQITDYEKTILEAAAKASVATETPITTHTDHGTMGDEQQRILTENGVPAERIVIGHSCGTSDHDYHMRIARGGSYLGFDRFGLDFIHPDDER